MGALGARRRSAARGGRARRRRRRHLDRSRAQLAAVRDAAAAVRRRRLRHASSTSTIPIELPTRAQMSLNLLQEVLDPGDGLALAASADPTKSVLFLFAYLDETVPNQSKQGLARGWGATRGDAVGRLASARARDAADGARRPTGSAAARGRAARARRATACSPANRAQHCSSCRRSRRSTATTTPDAHSSTPIRAGARLRPRLHRRLPRSATADRERRADARRKRLRRREDDGGVGAAETRGASKRRRARPTDARRRARRRARISGSSSSSARRRRDQAGLERAHAGDRFERGGGAERVAERALDRVDRRRRRARAEDQRERLGFHEVVERRRGAVGADVVDVGGARGRRRRARPRMARAAPRPSRSGPVMCTASAATP